MLLQSIQLFPVNLLHIAFFTLTSVGALLIWRSKVYRSLALFFVYQAMLMLFNFLEETRIINVSYLITPSLNLLVGSLIYFFVRSIVHDKELVTRHKLAHLIPLFCALPFTEFTQTVIAAGSVSQIIYLVLSFRLLNRYHKTSKSVSADAEAMGLIWIVKALSIFTIIVVTDLIRLNLQTSTLLSIESKMAWYFIDTLVLFCVSLFLLVKAVNKPRLFTEMVPYEKLLQTTKPKNNPEDVSTAQALFNSIEEMIVAEELFKQQRLSVTDIANTTDLNVKDLSWAINVGAAKNFCEYINSLRVQYLKNKIEQGIPEGTTLLDLAFESGFSSKSTFNSVFKKQVGITPSQFLNSVKP